jgi:hypothetical protein
MQDMQESEDGRFTAEEDSGGADKRERGATGSVGRCKGRAGVKTVVTCKSDPLDAAEWCGHDRWIGGHETTQILRRACMADVNAGTALCPDS